LAGGGRLAALMLSAGPEPLGPMSALGQSGHWGTSDQCPLYPRKMSAHSPGNITFTNAKASVTQITATTNDVATYSLMTSQAGGARSSTSSETKRGASRVLGMRISSSVSVGSLTSLFMAPLGIKAGCQRWLFDRPRFSGAMTLSPPES